MNIVEAVKEMRGGKIVRRRDYPSERWKIIKIPNRFDLIYHWWTDDNYTEEECLDSRMFSFDHIEAEWEAVE